MTELKIIKQQEVLGKEFTVYGTFEEPLVLAKDVAEWIDYSKTSQGYYNVSKMLKTVDEDEKTTITNSNSGGSKAFLTENGLYEVLMQSRKPIAKAFKKEVKKILKELRMTGQVKPSYMIENPAERARAWALEYEEKEELAQTVQLQAPKAEYADKVLACEGLMTTTEIAKDFGLSGVRLNKILAENNIIYRKGNKWFVYSDYDEMGLTKVHVYAPNQDNVSHTLNKWTQQGYKFVVELLQELGYVLNTEKTTEE